MRLIDADALIEHLRKDPLFYFVERYGVTGVIEAAPTIGPEQAADLSGYFDRLWKIAYERGKREAVKHGEWIYKGARGRFPICECSVCGNAENADWAILGDNVNYCPNCGAKMDGGKDDPER